MKKYITIFIILAMFVIINCGDDDDTAPCSNEQPRVTLTNNAATKADVQVKTTDGNTVNVNNILPATSSTQTTFTAGNIQFTITISGVTDPVIHNVTATYCIDYTITINADNTVTTSSVNR